MEQNGRSRRGTLPPKLCIARMRRAGWRLSPGMQDWGRGLQLAGSEQHREGLAGAAGEREQEVGAEACSSPGRHGKESAHRRKRRRGCRVSCVGRNKGTYNGSTTPVFLSPRKQNRPTWTAVIEGREDARPFVR